MVAVCFLILIDSPEVSYAWAKLFVRLKFVPIYFIGLDVIAVYITSIEMCFSILFLFYCPTRWIQ